MKFTSSLSSLLRKLTTEYKYFRGLVMNVDTENGDHWRGVPLSELYGSQSPWGAPEFPLVAPSYNHAVLYHVPSTGCVASDRPPKPQIGQDKWDSEHVRMPCSSHSLYPVTDDAAFDNYLFDSTSDVVAASRSGVFREIVSRLFSKLWPWGGSISAKSGALKSTGESHLKKRWEMIETALSKPLRNSHELADAILSYNTKFRNIWKFRGLHKLFNEHLEEEESQYFFDVTLPEIAKLALALPKLVQAPIPLLKQHKNRSVSLSQQQIASLLANAFFCTFPRRNSRKLSSEYSSYPYINFNTSWLYEATDSDSNLEKLKCICHYFRRVVTKVPVGTVTFSRRSVPCRSCPAWARSERSLASLPLHVDSQNTIEDADGLIQVDFANKFLGGGVLGHGCVQEEIRFVICPELLLSMLFTEELRPNEALIIIGAERYSRYSGYGGSFQWAGDFADNTPRDSAARRRVAVLAIDAVPYGRASQEFRREAITRELNKAWVGVSFDCGESGPERAAGLRRPGVATGNWGCGAFGGTPRLKSLLQLMACAQARRPMAYYTFGDRQLRDDIVHVYNLLARHHVTVGQLYNHIVRFAESDKDVKQGGLHAYLEHALTHTGSKPPSPVPAPTDECMDTSITEACPETIVRIDNESNDSPDLFSQDEMDQSLIEALEQSEKKEKTTEEATNKITNEQDNKKSENTSRQSLFDTIQKLDEGPSSPVLGNQNKNVTLNDSNLSMQSEVKSDPSSELKKKISKKITDYFSKKSI